MVTRIKNERRKKLKPNRSGFSKYYIEKKETLNDNKRDANNDDADDDVRKRKFDNYF